MSTESGACVQSALAIVEGMKSLGGQGCIGVTTGQLLCACVGSRIRAEYTVFGDSINLSARLMCKATAGMGDILCDYSTHHMAPAAATYTRLEPLVVLPCPALLQFGVDDTVECCLAFNGPYLSIQFCANPSFGS